MDAQDNDIPPQAPFRIQGFPTIKFRPAGSSEFIDYNGDRSLESLVEFVEATRQSGPGEAKTPVKRELDDEAEVDDEEEVPEHDEL